MKRYWRQILLFFFTVAFFVTVPLVLLENAGYRYNAKRGRVEMTGIIEARSIPRGATVIIDGVAQEKTTPAVFRRLLPEEYRVQIVKDGYLPWEKRLRVESGKTAFTAEVQLLRADLPKLVAAGQVVKSAWSPDGRRLASITAEGGYLDIQLWSTTGGASTLARLTDKEAVTELAWSPDGGKLLVSATSSAGTSVTVYFPGTSREPAAIDLLVPKGTWDIKWTDSQRLVLIGKDGVFLAQADGSAVSPLALGTGILDAVTRDRLTYLIRQDKNGTTYVERRDDREKPARLPELPNPDCRFADWRGLELYVADPGRGRTMVLGGDGVLVRELPGTSFVLADDGHAVLWNSFEVFVGDLATGRTDLVTRLSTPIRSCVWHPSGTHIFCATDSAVFAAESDDRDRRNTWELVKGGGFDGLAASSIGPVLRFTGVIGNQSGIFERGL